MCGNESFQTAHGVQEIPTRKIITVLCVLQEGQKGLKNKYGRQGFSFTSGA